ncbi:MAG: PEGA domain-containing protein [Acetobacteraceae bacterium]|nr:PEGA domain-containing protein [Acetobacteraceae bacterium]
MPMGWANGQEIFTGHHEIEITAAGYQSKRETVTIPAGTEQIMKIALERLPSPPTGTLRLDVSPAEAVVALDGKVMGSANDFRQELSTDPHVIEISAAGYQSRRETVTIAAGSERVMQIALVRLPAPPAMSTLKLDGTAVGSAKDFREELSAGTHDVEISAAGYQSKQETATTIAGAEQPIEIVSERLPQPPPTGTLELDVTTPGAVLILDGKRIGLAKGFRRELPAGVHEIKIEARGYHTQTKTLTLAGGELEHLPFKLTRSVPKYFQAAPLPPVIPSPSPAPPPVKRTCFLFFCG